MRPSAPSIYSESESESECSSSSDSDGDSDSGESEDRDRGSEGAELVLTSQALQAVAVAASASKAGRHATHTLTTPLQFGTNTPRSQRHTVLVHVSSSDIIPLNPEP